MNLHFAPTKALVTELQNHLPPRQKGMGHLRGWVCPACHHGLWALALEVWHRCPSSQRQVVRYHCVVLEH